MIGALVLAVPTSAGSVAGDGFGGCSAAQGGFAFHYTARLTVDELAWLRRFRIVVPGEVLPADQIRALKDEGAELFFYDWLTGFYLDAKPGEGDRHSWEAFVRRARPRWLLNADRPDAGPDGRGRAYYYDPFAPDLRLARSGRLAEKRRQASYAGVFFDLVGSASVPESVMREFNARHAESPFDEALREQLQTLKRMQPGALIFTNQGYRTPHAYLPVTDYDLSESLMTSYEWGQTVELVLEREGLVRTRETFYRPWEDLKPILNSIDAAVKRYNPAVKMFHLNYVNPSFRPAGRKEQVAGTEYDVFRKEVDRAAIYYGYVAAKLWAHESYSPSETVALVQDPVYFSDLGKPLGSGWEERDGLVRRYYEKGVVALNPASATRTADLGSPLVPADVRDLWDCYEGKSVGGLAVVIVPTTSPASGRTYPAGRVYLYLRR